MSKKEAILKTAARLFAAQGFDGTTTIQIVGQAGPTEASICYHFTGKDELLVHIPRDAFAEYFSRLKKIKRDNVTHFQKIRGSRARRHAERKPR